MSNVPIYILGCLTGTGAIVKSVGKIYQYQPQRITKYHQKFAVWASYQIRKIAGCACAGNAGNVSPRRRFKRKPIVGDPGMHHGTCVTHVPWCMSGSLTCGDGENVPGIPGACAPAILRIWQEAHAADTWYMICETRWKLHISFLTSAYFAWISQWVLFFQAPLELLTGVCIQYNCTFTM